MRAFPFQRIPALLILTCLPFTAAAADGTPDWLPPRPKQPAAPPPAPEKPAPDPGPSPVPKPETAPEPDPAVAEEEERAPLPAGSGAAKPDSALLPEEKETPVPEETDAAPPGGTAPDSSLSTAPAASDPASKRGPLFRVPGDQAWATARALGYCFTPEGGTGKRDGVHTGAAQFPNFLTSEINGTELLQIKPPVTWALAATSNVFYLFCDQAHNAVKLNPGWKIRGIRLQGPEWEWVACPRSGSNTASFSVRLRARKEAVAHTRVIFSGLTLEGPPGATDWRAAFPRLQQPAPEAAR